MKFNTTLSAILRGRWLIDKTFAEGQMPLVMQMLRGEDMRFNLLDKEEIPLPQLLTANAINNVYGVSPNSDLSSLQNDVAMVTLEGPLMKQGGMCSYGMVDHANMINRLANADNVSGIILNIDSPGGQADGTALLSDAIKAAGAKKPVLAIINDGMAASAAMWVASAANEIYVTQATDMVGSIGVYTTIADWAGHYKEFHKLNTQDVYAPQSTEKNKDYKDAIAGDTTGLEESLSVLADQFINTISANRAGKIKGNAWKTGKMFYANDAKAIGLIDGIKSFDEVVARMGQLIKKSAKQSKNNTMAFEKTMTAASAESFEVVDGGFLVTEDQMNGIEASLSTNEELAVSNSNLTTELSTANEALTAATALNATNATRIADLEAEVTALGKQPSGTGSAVITKKDETAEDGAAVPSYLDPNNPSNQFADSKIRLKK